MSLLSQPIMSGALLVDRLSMQRKIAAVILGIAVLTGASHLEVPMYPVPMTMQTAAVLLIAALYGCQLGSITVASWLGLAFMGAPLLAGGTGGPLKFVGPTAGYLYGFLIAASLIGWLSDRSWNGLNPHLAFIAMLVGSVIIMGLGWAWLATIIGAEKAWVAGVAPFLFGDLVKAILAVMLLVGVHISFTSKYLGQ